METPTIKETTERLINEKAKIDSEIERIDKEFLKIGTDIGRAKEKSNNIGSAFLNLAKELSEHPNTSRLSPEAHKRIMAWLNNPASF